MGRQKTMVSDRGSKVTIKTFYMIGVTLSSISYQHRFDETRGNRHFLFFESGLCRSHSFFGFEDIVCCLDHRVGIE
jgi:hypothetical protein